MRRRIIFVIVGILLGADSSAQIDALSLEQVIRLAQHQSIVARKSQTLKTTRYWEYRSYLSNYRPQITLEGRFPGFSRTSQEVIQPDGTIKFKGVSQSNIIGAITLSQPITFTGGTLFAATDLQRFNNQVSNSTIYNGTPIIFGLEQPIFGFNELKWDRKIEPLRYLESQKEFTAEMEGVAVTALDLFFNLLIAQVDYTIASTNVMNTDTIFSITEQKYEMGKISKNDLLQIQLETLKASKAQMTAERDLEAAELQLRSFIGYGQSDNWQLQLPNIIPNLLISEDQALQQAKANRHEVVAFQRRALEADREIALTKGTNGFSASLFGTIGYAKTAENASDIYSKPAEQQTLNLEFSLPIVDWGRAKSRTETAKANRKLIQNEIEQDRIDFEQVLLTELTLFRQYKKQVKLNKEVDDLAQTRYSIAQDRFLLGNLSITDLILALQEKDNSKRDYIQSLYNYWRTHYRIRLLTLYDFESRQTIKY